MTEYELAQLTQGQVNSVTSSYYYFYSLMSAFLVVSYLAAHRLPLSVGIFLIGLFLLNHLFLLTVIQSQLFALRAMAAETSRISTSGAGFAWLGPVPAPSAWYFYVPLVVLSVSLVASIAFFFYCRRANLRTQAAA